MIGLFRRKQPQDIEATLREYEVERSMMAAGWRFWPANATDDEKKSAIERYMDGGKPTWYPPGYDLITEGKLQV